MCRCTNVHVWTGVIDNIRGKKGGGLAQVSIKKIRNERGGGGGECGRINQLEDKKGGWVKRGEALGLCVLCAGRGSWRGE